MILQLGGERPVERIGGGGGSEGVAGAGQETDLGGEGGHPAGIEEEVEVAAGQRRFLGAGEHDEVAAAGEAVPVAGGSGGQECAADLAGQLGVGGQHGPEVPGAADHHGQVAGLERLADVAGVPRQSAGGGESLLAVEIGVELHGGDRLRRVHPRAPHAALAVGDLAAVLPHHREQVVGGVAGHAEGGHTGAVPDRPTNREQLVPGGRRLKAERGEDVGPVDERPRPGVPGHAVDGVVESGPLNEARYVPAGAAIGARAELGRLEGADVAELRRPGAAHLGDVGHLAAADGGDELVVGAGPRHELDGDLVARGRRPRTRWWPR